MQGWDEYTIDWEELVHLLFLWDYKVDEDFWVGFEVALAGWRVEAELQ